MFSSSKIIGPYHLGRIIGEGNFAKVKVAVNTESGEKVAVKIIEKKSIVDSKLKIQVMREIKTMKLLRHPNIVRIHEVLATKTKIYIVMEYVAGGPLSDKIAYGKRFPETEARKYFQQLMDAVEYCHRQGVCHRDLKPENLLLDWKGDLKVADFGFSALRKPHTPFSTSCGSPSYVAPEVITGKSYDGAAADVWSCGVILYELLAGFLPFEDCNLSNLYRKIVQGRYAPFPHWFSASQGKLISKILEPNPEQRWTVVEVMEDEWFQADYVSSLRIQLDDNEIISLDDVEAAFDSIISTEEIIGEPNVKPTSNLINAFKLIAMSDDLDLSGLFKEEHDETRRCFGSRHSVGETMEKIEAAAKDAMLNTKRMNRSMIKLHEPKRLTKSKSYFTLSAEIIEVTPTDCMVEISEPDADTMLTEYKEFCRGLSSMLNGKPRCESFDHHKFLAAESHEHTTPENIKLDK